MLFLYQTAIEDLPSEWKLMPIMSLILRLWVPRVPGILHAPRHVWRGLRVEKIHAMGRNR